MIGLLHLALIVVSASFLALIFILIIRRCRREDLAVSDAERSRNLSNGIARLHQVSPHHHQLDSKKPSHNLFRRGAPPKPAFSWAENPSLVTDAVENGWSRFAFAAPVSSSPSVKSARSLRLLGACAAGDRGGESAAEIGWEVCEGSADFMQKIRLNPDVKKAAVSSSSIAAAVIRTALPLPGPNLGNLSFPQEAYFEVRVLSGGDRTAEVGERGERAEGDKIKLIDEDFNAKNSPDTVNHGVSSHSQRRSKVEEGKIGKNEGIWVCVGLTGMNPLPLRFPGTFQGSIGFNSTGSLFLDGTKLVPESENTDWGTTDKVIGCGYNPGQKKVFFTVDSQVVHEIHCKTDDFCSPLYPTLAANSDVLVLVNLGQSPFRFAPANLQRTPNPCFVGPLGTSPALGYEDSRELFSMGRIDSLWMQRSAARSNNNTVNSLKALEYDQESEGDLFEIVLDSTGRSPYTTLSNY